MSDKYYTYAIYGPNGTEICRGKFTEAASGHLWNKAEARLQIFAPDLYTKGYRLRRVD